MAEKQQELGKGQGPRFTLGDEIARVAEGIALRALENTLDSGKIIFIPSLGLVITPGREIKEVAELTDEELKNNPHIYDPARKSNTGT